MHTLEFYGLFYLLIRHALLPKRICIKQHHFSYILTFDHVGHHVF